MTDRPWYRQVNADQWKAFWAAYLGWMLDGFDFTIIVLLFSDIQRSFGVNNAMAGAMVTATLLFRVVGGAAAGTAADRWGRKPALILSILWYSCFAFLSGFSTSYGMLVACRALFGIGMGGVWAAGMPLALEHWPAHLRGLASGLLQGGYAMGYILSALVYAFVYPLVQGSGRPRVARAALGRHPAVAGCRLDRHDASRRARYGSSASDSVREGKQGDAFSLARLFGRSLLPVTMHSILLMASLLFLYNSIWTFYPRWLGEAGRHRAAVPRVLQRRRDPRRYCDRPSVGDLAGTPRRRRPGHVDRPGVDSACTCSRAARRCCCVGAFAMGFFGTGNFGVAPGYLSERFPTAARAAGAGFSYQAGAALASFAATLIGALIDRGMPVANAMSICIAASSIAVLILLWLGPETRGREFRATD